MTTEFHPTEKNLNSVEGQNALNRAIRCDGCRKQTGKIEPVMTPTGPQGLCPSCYDVHVAPSGLGLGSATERMAAVDTQLQRNFNRHRSNIMHWTNREYGNLWAQARTDVNRQAYGIESPDGEEPEGPAAA